MPLSAGTRLGPYEILSQIGAGGMGEVYRARDTKLDRDVAIKVLPHLLAENPARLARFEHEAKVPAALNHPISRRFTVSKPTRSSWIWSKGRRWRTSRANIAAP
jgi:serine/threonine protein kinase